MLRWLSARGCSDAHGRSVVRPLPARVGRNGKTSPTSTSGPPRPRCAQEHAAGAARIERKLERIEVPDAPRERWQLKLDLAPATRGSDVVARLTAAVVRRGSFQLGPLDLEMARGERVALVGPNGAGSRR